MDSLLFTTYDQNKINELQDKLNKLDIPIKVMGLAEVDYAPQKSYSEATFLSNARSTAHRLAEFTNLPTLSESSGISVDYLINSLGILPYHHNGQDDKAKLLGDLGGILAKSEPQVIIQPLFLLGLVKKVMILLARAELVD